MLAPVKSGKKGKKMGKKWKGASTAVPTRDPSDLTIHMRRHICRIYKRGAAAKKKRNPSTRLLKKSCFAGCSKRTRCKAPEILRSEAYLPVRRNDEGPAGRQGKRRRWSFFSKLLQRDVKRESGERTLFRPYSIHKPSSYRGGLCN